MLYTIMRKSKVGSPGGEPQGMLILCRRRSKLETYPAERNHEREDMAKLFATRTLT